MNRFPLAGAALMLMAVPAMASPPPIGWQGNMKPAILCDKQEQIKDIFEALRVSEASAAQKYAVYLAQKNAKDEPTCVVSATQGMYGKRAGLGEVTVSGATLKAWALHVLNPVGEGWLLYMEPATPVQDFNRPGWV